VVCESADTFWFVTVLLAEGSVVALDSAANFCCGCDAAWFGDSAAEGIVVAVAVFAFVLIAGLVVATACLSVSALLDALICTPLIAAAVGVWATLLFAAEALLCLVVVSSWIDFAIAAIEECDFSCSSVVVNEVARIDATVPEDAGRFVLLIPEASRDVESGALDVSDDDEVLMSPADATSTEDSCSKLFTVAVALAVEATVRVWCADACTSAAPLAVIVGVVVEAG
jgi:hypothetical protein